MIVYKYLEAKWAKAMVEEGSIRVGTLAYYQAMEKHRPLIGDAHEGQRTVVLGQPGAMTAEEMPPLAAAMMRNAFDVPPDAAARGIIVANNLIIQRNWVPNCFVYCTSSELSADARGEYDTCVEISDRDRFFGLIGTDLVKHVRRTLRQFLGPVKYEPRQVDALSAEYLFPAFSKGLEFEKQREVRGVWGVEDPKLEIFVEEGYLDRTIPELRDLVRLVDVPENEAPLPPS